MNEQKNLELLIKVNEILRFGCWRLDNTQSTHKELFRIGSFFFIFTFTRDKDVCHRSLCEVTREQYGAEITKITRLSPHQQCGNWQDKDNRYETKRFRNYTWKKVISSADCTFLHTEATNALWELYNQTLQHPNPPKQPSLSLGKEKTEQIQKAMSLSKELAIAYENVCAIGIDDIDKLKAFKISYIRAIEHISDLTPAERYTLYQNLKVTNKGKTREQALQFLKIPFYNANTNKMNLAKLEAILYQKVEEYRKESINDAIRNATAKPYEERKKLYQRLMSLSKERKKQVLKELGVDVQAIDLNNYSLTPIKQAIAASIGINLEKF